MKRGEELFDQLAKKLQISSSCSYSRRGCVGWGRQALPFDDNILIKKSIFFN
ncbi:MAG: hypothetical protein ACFFC6_04210 [Promethearchaeota archaeon]